VIRKLVIVEVYHAAACLLAGEGQAGLGRGFDARPGGVERAKPRRGLRCPAREPELHHRNPEPKAVVLEQMVRDVGAKAVAGRLDQQAEGPKPAELEVLHGRDPALPERRPVLLDRADRDEGLARPVVPGELAEPARDEQLAPRLLDIHRLAARVGHGGHRDPVQTAGLDRHRDRLPRRGRSRARPALAARLSGPLLPLFLLLRSRLLDLGPLRRLAQALGRSPVRRSRRLRLGSGKRDRRDQKQRYPQTHARIERRDTTEQVDEQDEGAP
jgi:hypothetical protein